MNPDFANVTFVVSISSIEDYKKYDIFDLGPFLRLNVMTKLSL